MYMYTVWCNTRNWLVSTYNIHMDLTSINCSKEVHHMVLNYNRKQTECTCINFKITSISLLKEKFHMNFFKPDLEVHDVHEGEIVEGEGLDHILLDVVDHLEL